MNIAIIGAGHIGEIHAKAIGETKMARVVAVMDRVEEKGTSFAQKFGVQYYRTLDEVLARKDVDVVAICTPTFLHADMVVQAAKAGKNIFCEKPLAMNNEEASRMLEAVKRHHVKAMTGHILRFWPSYIRIKGIIDSGELGKLLHIYCERLMPICPWVEGGWNRDEKMGGGAAVDIQIHDVDYILWLLGEPKRLKSSGVYNPRFGGWMHMGTSIEFDNGQSALVQAGWGLPENFPFTNVIRVVCESGTIEWSSRVSMQGWNKSDQVPISVYRFDGRLIHEEPKDTDSFFLEWQYFLDCLTHDKEIEISNFHDGARSLQLVLASIESAKTHSVVEWQPRETQAKGGKK